jgi:lipopolysaccharide transport system permease protein
VSELNRAVAIPTLIIEPTTGWVPARLGELWEYRELLYFLIWRDVKIRYKQTALGAAWAILQPVLTMIIFTVFFGRLAKMPSDGVPYPVFAFCGLLPWQLFSRAVTESSSSLVANQHLITKVYFPRLIIPIAGVLASLVDFAIAFGVLIVLMTWYGIAWTSSAVFLPVFVVMSVATALGTGLWLSALNVKYRDVRYTLPFLTQFWFFATPIVYPSSLMTEKWRIVYGLNPMAGVVDGFRWALLGIGGPQPMLLVSAAVILVTLVGGLYYFKRTEKSFADIV